jgi:cyanophycinase
MRPLDPRAHLKGSAPGLFPAGPPLVALSLVLAVASSGCAAPDAAVGQDPAEPSPGALVVIGGGLSADNAEVYEAILGAREGTGPICVVPTAGADPAASAVGAVARFERYGGEGAARALALTLEAPERAFDPEAATDLLGCGGFYFTGGVQSRILDFFLPEGVETPVYRALMDRWRAGAVVSGSSAGAAMKSNPMIAGGTSAGAFTRGTGEGGVRLTPGMGFLPDLLVDQHFLARGRIGRLLVAVTAPGGIPLGAGVDENTALVVRGSEFEVVGASGVVLVDARGAIPTGDGGFGGIRLQLLGPGDRVSLDPGARVRPRPGKAALRNLAGDASEPGSGAASADPFERWAFLHALEAYGSAPTRDRALVFVRADGGEIRLVPAQGFRALGDPEGRGRGADGSALGISVGPLEVEIRLPAGASDSAPSGAK